MFFEEPRGLHQGRRERRRKLQGPVRSVHFARVRGGVWGIEKGLIFFPLLAAPLFSVGGKKKCLHLFVKWCVVGEVYSEN